MYEFIGIGWHIYESLSYMWEFDGVCESGLLYYAREWLCLCESIINSFVPCGLDDQHELLGYAQMYFKISKAWWSNYSWLLYSNFNLP